MNPPHDNKLSVTPIDRLNAPHIDQLVALYRNEFWCATRTRPDVEKMLAHTDIVIGAVDASGNLIGFARVLTDYTYKATLYDVIVHPDWRGKKLGAWLMDRVLAHPDLKGVQHFDLYCLPEMFEFYRRWGFSEELGRLSLMRRVRPNIS